MVLKACSRSTPQPARLYDHTRTPDPRSAAASMSHQKARAPHPASKMPDQPDVEAGAAKAGKRCPIAEIERRDIIRLERSGMSDGFTKFFLKKFAKSGSWRCWFSCARFFGILMFMRFLYLCKSTNTKILCQ